MEQTSGWKASEIYFPQNQLDALVEAQQCPAIDTGVLI